MIEALIAGEADANKLAALGSWRLAASREALGSCQEFRV